MTTVLIVLLIAAAGFIVFDLAELAKLKNQNEALIDFIMFLAESHDSIEFDLHNYTKEEYNPNR